MNQEIPQPPQPSDETSHQPLNIPHTELKIKLLKGALYKQQKELWQLLLNDQKVIRDYFAQIGLELFLDEAEGYAFLRQMSFQSGETTLPTLITRRQLSFPVSLLLVLLRKRMIEHDTEDSGVKLVVSRAEIYDWLKPFYPDTHNQVKLQDKFDSGITKVKEMGFLNAVGETNDDFEVKRILRAFVTAQWLDEINQKLETYKPQPAETNDSD